MKCKQQTGHVEGHLYAAYCVSCVVNTCQPSLMRSVVFEIEKSSVHVILIFLNPLPEHVTWQMIANGISYLYTVCLH